MRSSVLHLTLCMPPSTNLIGTFATVPSHAGRWARSTNGSGSTLLPTAGHGNSDSNSFITVASDCTVRGFLIYYPLQTCGDADPIPYPWSLDLVADNAAVQDIEILNPFNAVRAVLAGALCRRTNNTLNQ